MTSALSGIPTVLTLGADPYDYDVYLVSLSMRYRFGRPAATAPGAPEPQAAGGQRRRSLRRGRWRACVVWALAAPQFALAQDRLEEVVVTATKQLQSLQKTPAAITAMSGEALIEAGVADIRCAKAFVPSVRFQQENASTEIYIRGVGSTLDVPQIEPPTTFNFNGINIPREATSVPLYDIEQLEVGNHSLLPSAPRRICGHPPNLVPKGIDPATGQLDVNSYLNDDPWEDRFPPPYDAQLPFGQPRAEEQRYDNDMVGAQIDLRTADDLTFTYVPSYLKMSVSADYWLGAYPGNKSDAYDLATAFPVSIVDAHRIEGAALFGEATLDIAEGTRVTIGGRYGRDDRSGRGRFFDGTSLAPYIYEKDFDNFDYKLGLDHDLTQDIMLYVATQTGFQPGTFNPYASTPQVSNAVDPAELTAYTAGLKSRLLDGRLQINDEVFLYDYEGMFASAYNTVINAVQTFNAQEVEIYGNQLDVIWRLAQTARVSLSVGYLQARNVRFELPDGTADFDGDHFRHTPGGRNSPTSSRTRLSPTSPQGIAGALARGSGISRTKP